MTDKITGGATFNHGKVEEEDDGAKDGQTGAVT